MIHFYCLAVEAGFYSDVVECLPVDPATWVRFPAGAGKIFSLYDRNKADGAGRSTTKSTLSCYQNERKLPLAVNYVKVGTQDWCLCDP